MIEQTPEIGELVKALAVAQGKITGALKDSANPFFKSKYADLASVWDACRGPLSDNGIAVIQQTTADDSGVFVITTLAHESGQWMRSALRLHPKDDTPQGIGSAITYGRRYALASAVGVAQVDDDGNAASGRDDKEEAQPKWRAADTRKATADSQRLIKASVDTPDALKSIWEEIKDDEVYASAVWQKLPNPLKDTIRDLMKLPSVGAVAGNHREARW